VLSRTNVTNSLPWACAIAGAALAANAHAQQWIPLNNGGVAARGTDIYMDQSINPGEIEVCGSYIDISGNQSFTTWRPFTSVPGAAPVAYGHFLGPGEQSQANAGSFDNSGNTVVVGQATLAPIGTVGASISFDYGAQIILDFNLRPGQQNARLTGISGFQFHAVGTATGPAGGAQTVALAFDYVNPPRAFSPGLPFCQQESGDAVGDFGSEVGVVSCGTTARVIDHFDGTVIETVPTTPGSTNISFAAISNGGFSAVNYIDAGGVQRAALWDGAFFTPFPPATPGATATVTDYSGAGTVAAVGFETLPGGQTQGLVWVERFSGGPVPNMSFVPITLNQLAAFNGLPVLPPNMAQATQISAMTRDGSALLVNGLNVFTPRGETENAIEGTNETAVLAGIDVPSEQDCPADFDGDNEVAASDLSILLAAWGANPGSPANFDGDGDVDASDLSVLLAAWGPCP